MQAAQKERLAAALEDLGVDAIEAGFPVASAGERDAVRAVSRVVKRAEVVALCRARASDLEAAWEAIRGAQRPMLHIFLPVSNLRLKASLKRSKREALGLVRESVSMAAKLCPNVEFTAVDATRADPLFLREAILVAVEAGATIVSVPDSVGYATPEEYAALTRKITSAIAGTGAILAAHCHDDLGLAVANTLAGVAAGARQVECCVNGLGERAGNAALEELVMALKVRRDRYRVDVGVRTEKLAKASRLVSEVTGFPVPPNKAVVGSNAFSVQAGVHQAGLLKNPSAYELLIPESFGLGARRIVLGKHSGRAAVGYRLRMLGYELCEDELSRLFPTFKALADERVEVTDADLHSLLKEFEHCCEVSKPQRTWV